MYTFIQTSDPGIAEIGDTWWNISDNKVYHYDPPWTQLTISGDDWAPVDMVDWQHTHHQGIVPEEIQIDPQGTYSTPYGAFIGTLPENWYCSQRCPYTGSIVKDYWRTSVTGIKGLDIIAQGITAASGGHGVYYSLSNSNFLANPSSGKAIALKVNSSGTYEFYSSGFTQIFTDAFPSYQQENNLRIESTEAGPIEVTLNGTLIRTYSEPSSGYMNDMYGYALSVCGDGSAQRRGYTRFYNTLILEV